MSENDVQTGASRSDGSENPGRVSVVIPTYNQATHLGVVLANLRETGISSDIVVVDDGSTDETRSVLEELEGPDLKVLHAGTNSGKGHAIRRGIESVDGEVVLLHNANLAYSAEEYRSLIDPVSRNEADAVFGSRYLDAKATGSVLQRMADSVMAGFLRFLYGQSVTDVSTGMKALSRRVLDRIDLEADCSSVDVELTTKLIRLGGRLKEVPLDYRPRNLRGLRSRDLTDIPSIFRTLFSNRARVSQDSLEEGLHRLDGLSGYNEWLMSWIEKDIGKRILEIGSGIGTVGNLLPRAEKVILTDVEDGFIEHLKSRFADREEVEVSYLDAQDPTLPERLGPERLDTIVCINCLEHIEKDDVALKNMRDILVDEGKLLLIVPAMQVLYGSLDEAVYHYRRYDKDVLVQRVEEAGFRIETVAYKNLIGAIGWFVNARILKKTVVTHGSIFIFKLILPFIKLFESIVTLPAGQSLVLIGTRTPAR